jgi:predicted HicB family RNase H-like nuclease
MEYIGYTSLIQYSKDDGCFIGKVIGIEDQIIFDAPSFDEISKVFEADVDSYVRYCRKKGREPNKPVSEVIVHVSSAPYARIAQEADYDGIPVHTLLETALQKFVAQHT